MRTEGGRINEEDQSDLRIEEGESTRGDQSNQHTDGG